MRRMLIGWMILALAGCSSPDKQDGDNNGWTFNNDAGGEPDTGSDGGGGGGDAGPDAGPGPGAVTFRLLNESEVPVFAYHVAGAFAPCAAGRFVEVLENGESQRIKDDCSLCGCDEADCPVCLFDCAPGADPDYEQLGVGEARSFTWDGLFRVEQPNGEGGICLADRAPQADTLTARFCWGHAFEVTSDPWGDITDIECQDVEFSPDEPLVEVTILPTAREPVEFRLTSGTQNTLYAALGLADRCEASEWLRLSQEDRPLVLSPPCGQCLCDEVAAGEMCLTPCPGAPCEPPTAELYELPPGGQRSYLWNRVEYVDDIVDNRSCLHDRLATGELTATLCWGEQFDETTNSIADIQCETIQFDPYLDPNVSHTITAAP